MDDLPLPLYGDGSAVRDYLYVIDHCDAIYRVLKDGTPGRAFNIGTEVETSGVELATTLLKLMDKPESLMKFVEDRAGHDYRYSVNATRLRTELGWRPTVSLHVGLERTVAWYRENEGWWRRLKSPEYWEYYRRVYKFK
jgi:dTDP-glucose 4,6-dehydratase